MTDAPIAGHQPADPALAGLLHDIIADPLEDVYRLVYAERLDELAGDVPCGKCNGIGWTTRLKAGEAYRPEPPSLIPDFATVGCPACDGQRDRRGTGRVSNGFAERAEFIRVQCELAKWPGCATFYGAGLARPWCGEDDCRGCALRRRGRELLTAPRPGWHPPLPAGWRWVWGTPPGGKLTIGWVRLTEPIGTVEFEFRRGFPDSAALPLWRWCGESRCRQCGAGGARPEDCARCGGTGGVDALGPLLARAAPLTEVRLSDKRPDAHTPPHGDTNYSWYNVGFEDDEATIPEPLFDLMTGWMPSLTAGTIRKAYPTPDAARLALGRAAVTLARGAHPGLAALPAIRWPLEGPA